MVGRIVDRFPVHNSAVVVVQIEDLSAAVQADRADGVRQPEAMPQK